MGLKYETAQELLVLSLCRGTSAQANLHTHTQSMEVYEDSNETLDL